ncbi:hypothetical protein CRUP_023692 [Coryphaenoides rupestris]|nr:hypothetical protein CRUP_023692 [Coryphaenoides rupestris]
MTTEQNSSHAEKAHPTAPPVAPKLHVQHALSREAITIHFSPLGQEDGGQHDDDEDEPSWENISARASAAQDDSGVVTAVEASEEMLEEALLDSATPESSATPPPLAAGRPRTMSPTPRLSSFPTEMKVLNAPSSSSSSSPTKSVSLPSIDKPPFSMIKSLSSDAEPRDAVPSTGGHLLVKHRQLMRTLVKSLSSDTSEGSSSMPRLSDSRLNLQLFKQFTQSRASGSTTAVPTANDSKTAPCSPLPSQESRSFFKVSEVEARIEDTRRRLSEVMYEPLQKLSKIIDEKSMVGSVANYRSSKASSVSGSELSNMSSFGSLTQLESNNNSYCIKEEEGGDWDSESPNSASSNRAESPVSSPTDNKSPKKPVSSMSLDVCSMSALAKLEEDEYCVLSTEDFEMCTDTDGDRRDRTDYTGSSSTQGKVSPCGSTGPCSEDDLELEDPAPYVPVYPLIILAVLVYGYFVLPLPTYIGGLLLGVGLGFFIAIGVVWLAGPKSSGRGFQHLKRRRELCSMARFTIKEPDLFKGWMNEIAAYDPETYHATLTQSVYVRLEGSTLRLSKPNRNIPRRATHNEPKPDVSYVSQKIYDLMDSKVYLVPQPLAKKRVWNKKYPICIELAKQDDFMSKAEGERPDVVKDLTASVPGDRGGGGARTGGAQGKGKASLSRRDLTLYLFGRTGREKEEWFQRILVAARGKARMTRAASRVGSKHMLRSLSPGSSRGSSEEALASPPNTKDPPASSSTAAAPAATLPGSAKAKALLDYSAYMTSLMPTQAASPVTASPPVGSPQSSPEAAKKLPGGPQAQATEEEEQPMAWLNAMLGRLLWDFLGEPHWAEMLPYFMNELTLTELDMGVATPRILGASRPSIDHRGLWFDLDVSYSGSFLMSLETKMNLIRLGKEEEPLRVESGKDGLVGGHKSSKIMRLVDKITKSKYFQKATETEFIKKKMEEVVLWVCSRRGALCCRYGFRTPPHLELKARPKLGEREVTFAHVTDWIEKKLYQEFQPAEGVADQQ